MRPHRSAHRPQGGRGIRIARSADEIESAYDAAQQEAIACFGDGDIYLEKFLVNPRHIEIQVLADRHSIAWPCMVISS